MRCETPTSMPFTVFTRDYPELGIIELATFGLTVNVQNGRFHMDLFEGKSFGSPKDFGFLTNERIVVEV